MYCIYSVQTVHPNCHSFLPRIIRLDRHIGYQIYLADTNTNMLVLKTGYGHMSISIGLINIGFIGIAQYQLNIKIDIGSWYLDAQASVSAKISALRIYHISYTSISLAMYIYMYIMEECPSRIA